MTDFRDQIRDPADAITALIRSQLLDVHVALPAIVTEAFDPVRCSVTVKPVLRRPIPAADGTHPAEELPEIYDVPVCFPMFGSFQITMPISVGDVCMLVFPDYDPGAWRANGAETHPGDIRRHHLSGACALFGGMRTLANQLTSFNTNGIEIGPSSGVRTTFTSGGVEVGGSTDASALASKVDALASKFNDHVADYNLHKHPGVTTGGGTSAVGDTPSSAYSGGASASSVLKVSS